MTLVSACVMTLQVQSGLFELTHVQIFVTFHLDSALRTTEVKLT
jgi:hypothetical protein